MMRPAPALYAAAVSWGKMDHQNLALQCRQLLIPENFGLCRGNILHRFKKTAVC